MIKNESNLFECAIKENSLMNIYILRETNDANTLLKKLETSFGTSKFKHVIKCECD